MIRAMKATFELEAIELELNGGPIAGVDEAGRGPLAGPVVAAAVVLDPAFISDGIADSKALDAKCLSIAAASIVAKVVRDAMMAELARDYPHYGFDRHKGYGTREHHEAIARHGVTPHHRRSFRPVQLALGLV